MGWIWFYPARKSKKFPWLFSRKIPIFGLYFPAYNSMRLFWWEFFRLLSFSGTQFLKIDWSNGNTEKKNRKIQPKNGQHYDAECKIRKWKKSWKISPKHPTADQANVHHPNIHPHTSKGPSIDCKFLLLLFTFYLVFTSSFHHLISSNTSAGCFALFFFRGQCLFPLFEKGPKKSQSKMKMKINAKPFPSIHSFTRKLTGLSPATLGPDLHWISLTKHRLFGRAHTHSLVRSSLCSNIELMCLSGENS